LTHRLLSAMTLPALRQGPIILFFIKFFITTP
jgi:hypothetical protein